MDDGFRVTRPLDGLVRIIATEPFEVDGIRYEPPYWKREQYWLGGAADPQRQGGGAFFSIKRGDGCQFSALECPGHRAYFEDIV